MVGRCVSYKESLSRGHVSFQGNLSDWPPIRRLSSAPNHENPAGPRFSTGLPMYIFELVNNKGRVLKRILPRYRHQKFYRSVHLRRFGVLLSGIWFLRCRGFSAWFFQKCSEKLAQQNLATRVAGFVLLFIWPNYSDLFPPAGHPKWWWFSKGTSPKSRKNQVSELICPDLFAYKGDFSREIFFTP